MNIYFGDPSLKKLSASHIYAWRLGLKTGQYYLRSRPARDAIQFTLDVDTLEAKEGQYLTKNLSKAEMDAQRRSKRKRTHQESTVAADTTVVQSSGTDLTKKRKTTAEGDGEQMQKPNDITKTKAADEKDDGKKKEEKPWEGKEEQDLGDTWNICEGCQ